MKRAVIFAMLIAGTAGLAAAQTSDPKRQPILVAFRAGTTIGAVVSDHVRVRSLPSTSGRILASVDAGAIAEVLEISKTPQDIGDGPFWWYRVQFWGATTGWVYGEFFFTIRNDGTEGDEGFPVRVGALDFLLVEFTRQSAPDNRMYDTIMKMPVLVYQSEVKGFPIRISPDTQTSFIHLAPSPENWWIMKEESDGPRIPKVTAVTEQAPDNVVVTVTSGFSDDTLDLRCVPRGDDTRSYFEVTSIQQN